MPQLEALKRDSAIRSLAERNLELDTFIMILMRKIFAAGFENGVVVGVEFNLGIRRACCVEKRRKAGSLSPSNMQSGGSRQRPANNLCSARVAALGREGSVVSPVPFLAGLNSGQLISSKFCHLMDSSC
jgi:hypothetical protein